MGKLFSGSTKVKTATDKVSKEAFNITKPALQRGVNESLSLADYLDGSPVYGGQRVAGLNRFQTGSADMLGGFSQGFTPFALGAGADLGFSNIGYGNQFGANAADIYNRFSGDPTQDIINAAGAYANNPFVDGMIDSAGRDVVRNLYENQLPGVARAAAGTGNINSTRAGVESAIMQRGAADRLTDLSNDIRGKFFGQGLTMAQNQYNQNLQNMLSANADMLNAGKFGMQALSGTQDLADSGFNQGQSSGAMYQIQNQNELDAEKAKYSEYMDNYAQLIGLLQGQAQAGKGFTSVAGTAAQNNPSIASQVGGFMKAFMPF